MVSFPKIRNTLGETGRKEKSRVRFWTHEVEMPNRHSGRDVNYTIGCTGLELRAKAEAKIKIGHHHYIDNI